MTERKLIVYIAMSVDGFIATKDHDLSWLSIAEDKDEDYGYSEFVKGIDTYMVGGTTYRKVLELTDGKLPQVDMYENCYVISNSQSPKINGVEFYSGDLKPFVTKLKSQKGENIYCDGGSQIIKQLMKDNLIDEYIISVIPIILGDGIRLFPEGLDSIKLKALPSKYFEKGVVQLHYGKA